LIDQDGAIGLKPTWHVPPPQAKMYDTRCATPHCPICRRGTNLTARYRSCAVRVAVRWSL